MSRFHPAHITCSNIWDSPYNQIPFLKLRIWHIQCKSAVYREHCRIWDVFKFLTMGQLLQSTHLYNTPHPPVWGVVGLNIDRCIRQSGMLVSPLPSVSPTFIHLEKNRPIRGLYRHISLKDRRRCYPKTPTAQLIFWLTQAHQLCWGGWEIGNAISCTECMC